MQVLAGLSELDAKIAECDRAERVSDEALRRLLATFCMEFPLDLPADPFSSAYRAAQLELYERIAGLPYSVERERTEFDVAAAVRRPFPWYTGSSATAGEYIMAIGFALHTMALSPRSRVLEFGPGWGHSTLWLAQLGHDVTAVEIEPRFCDLIAERARREGVSVAIVNRDFFWVEDRIGEPEFDAVLFYDCFHHCHDHLRLLRALDRVVAKNGRVFFAAEPIVPDFPLPWGLRLDGWSLWGIRKNGWLELGFRDDYFRKALSVTGWFGRKIAVAAIDRLRVWEARRHADAVFRYTADDSRLGTHVGVRCNALIIVEGASAGTALFGPYLDLPAGSYRARILLAAGTVVEGTADMDVACDGGRRRLATRQVSGPLREDRPMTLELVFSAREDIAGVEVRLFCTSRFSVVVDAVEIAAIGAE